ncbi:MAG: hypothetical protein HZY78_03725 [Burkholderiaceae bacterium]|nr:MAG: hypothetical protein HZY78_03725 [Burkholderiaceae bacterium]
MSMSVALRWWGSVQEFPDGAALEHGMVDAGLIEGLADAAQRMRLQQVLCRVRLLLGLEALHPRGRQARSQTVRDQSLPPEPGEAMGQEEVDEALRVRAGQRCFERAGGQLAERARHGQAVPVPHCAGRWRHASPYVAWRRPREPHRHPAGADARTRTRGHAGKHPSRHQKQ